MIIKKIFLFSFFSLSFLFSLTLIFPTFVSWDWWRLIVGVGLVGLIVPTSFALANALGIQRSRWMFVSQISEFKEKSVFEAATLLMVLSTAIAMYLQINEMQKAYEQLAKQTQAALTQAEAAEKTAEGNKEDLALANRAWVGAFDADLSSQPTLGADLAVTVVYKNFGRSPGIGVTVAGGLLVSNSQLPAIQNWAACNLNQVTQSSQVVYPSTDSNSNRTFLKLDGNQVTQAVLNGSDSIFALGCITYKTFDKIRQSAFCYTWNSQLSAKNNTGTKMNFCQFGAGAT